MVDEPTRPEEPVTQPADAGTQPGDFEKGATQPDVVDTGEFDEAQTRKGQVKAPSLEARVSNSRFEPGAIVATDYRIEACIGQGGMGMVYKAFDTVLNLPRAIKVVTVQDRHELQSLRREAKMMAEINHPNIASIIHFYEEERVLVQEYVEGDTLHKAVKESDQRVQEHCVEIVMQLCEGFNAMHSRGLRHLDFKLANTMLRSDMSADEGGAVKIIDFGLAEIAADGKTVKAMGGTPPYMPPEQLLHQPVDHRTDIYSLSASIIELLRVGEADPKFVTPGMLTTIDQLRTSGIRRMTGSEQTEAPLEEFIELYESRVQELREEYKIPLQGQEQSEEQVLWNLAFKGLHPNPDARLQDVMEIPNALDEYRDEQAKLAARGHRRTGGIVGVAGAATVLGTIGVYAIWNPLALRDAERTLLQAGAFQEVGDVVTASRHLHEAEQYLGRVFIPVFRRGRVNAAKHSTAMGLGEVARRRDQPELARDHYERAERFLPNDDHSAALYLAARRAEVGTTEKAPDLEEAKRLLQQRWQQTQEPAAAYSLADLLSTQAEHLPEEEGLQQQEAALAVLDQAIALTAEAVGHPTPEAQANIALLQVERGRILRKTGKYDDAVTAYNNARATSMAQGNINLTARIDRYLAVLEANKGEFESAVSRLSQTIDWLIAWEEKETGHGVDPSQSRIGGLGYAYELRAGLNVELGDLEAAVADAELAIAIAENNNDLWGLRDACYTIGNGLVIYKKHAEGQAWLQRGARYAAELGDQYYEGLCISVIAESFYFQDLFHKADAQYARARDLMRAQVHDPIRVYTLAMHGEVKLALGQVDAASALFDEAYTLSLGVPDKGIPRDVYNEFMAMMGKGRVREARDLPSEALGWYVKAGMRAREEGFGSLAEEATAARERVVQTIR